MNRICLLGLGNPGARYAGTRHNIGCDWVDAVAESIFPQKKWAEKFEALWMTGEFSNCEIHILKPQTFMNESGRSLTSFRSKYQGELRCIAVYDDMDLEVGRLRYRLSGSDGGNRGMRSLNEHSGGKDIERVRIGIGRPPVDAKDYVLSRFNPTERSVMNELMMEAGAHFKLLVEDTTKAMNALNSWKSKSLNSGNEKKEPSE